MKNVMDWMVSEGIAKNDFQASAIVNGLKLYELKDDEARKARVRLYRDWRNTKIFGKLTKPCFEKAILGELVSQLPLVDGAFLSFENQRKSQEASDMDIRIEEDGLH